MKYMVNKSRSVFAGITSAFFLLSGIYFLFNKYFLQAGVFLIFALIYGCMFYHNAKEVTVTDDAVTLSFLKKPLKQYKWEEVQEIGLIGEKLYSKAKKNAGHLYFYFSKKNLTIPERLRLVMKWPPKDMIYVEFSEELYSYLCMNWKRGVINFNAGSDYPDTEE
ncbi:MAG: hypothetical protein HUJ72_00215 [Blautia sp.]|nr:hypothetical protein [Blautia sp.]